MMTGRTTTMLSPGTMLGGRYRLDERIAGGGMGDVWRGTDEVLGRTVAVKVLLPALLEEPGFAERFRGEARTMATINHPGVVDVYDYGNENGTAFLVMEYIEGDALSRTLSRVGRLTPARTMALIAQAADALHAAHEKGIVHRDVKPGNLLVRPNGTLVLTDFGIARSAMVGQLTAAGSVLGTASYISPEQAAGQGATPLSDVYALGVVAYQCLSGRRPFEGDNPLEIAMRHVRDQPPPLPPDIPPPARQIVETAMAKDPARALPERRRARPGRPPCRRPARGGEHRQPSGRAAERDAGLADGAARIAGGAPVRRSARRSPACRDADVRPAGRPDLRPARQSGRPAGGSGPVSGGPAGGTSPARPARRRLPARLRRVRWPGGYPPARWARPPAAPAPVRRGPTPGRSPARPAARTAGPPGDVAAGGTRVMPAGRRPTGPGVPGGGQPPGPGQFAPRRGRRAAAAAAGLRHRLHVRADQRRGRPVATAPGGAPGRAGQPSADRHDRADRGLGALVLILCVGGGVFLVNNLGDDKKTPATGTAAPRPARRRPARPRRSTATASKDKPIANVRNHLEKTDGFTVKETEVDDGARAGTVVEVSPCGAQPKGSEVTVTVSNGRGPGNGGGASGGPNCHVRRRLPVRHPVSAVAPVTTRR